MTNEFTREARYAVLKSADVMQCLTVSEFIELRRIQAKVEEHRAEIGKPPLDCVVVESDWPEYEPTWRAIEARVTGAQPAPSFADAYQGAMEEVAIWKKRALEAEELNRKFIAEINGPTYMGEPAQPAPIVPVGWLHAIDEALVVAHLGVANPADTYEQARKKLDSLIGFHIDVATDPAVNGGWKLVPAALLVAVADLVAQMEIVARVGFVDTPDDKDSCAAFCVAEGTWLELVKCVETLTASLAALETKP